MRIKDKRYKENKKRSLFLIIVLVFGTLLLSYLVDPLMIHNVYKIILISSVQSSLYLFFIKKGLLKNGNKR
ncbi:MAG: hypothetical protein ACOC56_01525 [Atribacterota bacterium]